MEDLTPYPKELIQRYRKIWLGTTIGDAFETTCRIVPGKVAVVDGERRLTFAEIREHVHSAAKAFLTLGLRPGSSVLLQIPNSAEAIYVYLALSMIGIHPVLCLPRHGQKELERFADLTKATTWIGTAKEGGIEYSSLIAAVQKRNPSLVNTIVVRSEKRSHFISLTDLIKDATQMPRLDTDLERFSPSPDDILHLAPTGGTTGLPKLVARTHNAHLCKAYYFARAAERGASDIDLIVAPINHDAPQLAHLAFMALFGSTLVFCPSPKPKTILEYLVQERVTFSLLVPTLLSDLSKEPDIENQLFSPDLKLSYAGAPASQDLIRTICRRFRCRFHSVYGMTEGVGTITRSTDSPEVVARTVGKPMCPFEEYRIVDEMGNEIPVGHEGEIVAQGPCIISGYYKSQDEDGKAFTADGFFKTGDVGKYDSKGNLIVTARKKDLIKRGAETIIPFEIEEMIAGHPKVSKVAVIGMPDERLGEKICAYVQLLPHQKMPFEELISYLKKNGASKMLLPERLEILCEFPMTPMQKIDKQALKRDILTRLTAG